MTGPAVHVIAPAPAGGAESVVFALAAGSSETCRVAILNQTAVGHDAVLPLTQRLLAAGIRVEEIRCGLRRYRAEAFALATRLHAWSATLVHTHGYHANWVGRRAARAVGTPVVATAHGYLEGGWKERLYNWADRRQLRAFDAVMAVSLGIREQLIRAGCDPDRVHLVPNGLTPTVTLPRDDARAELGLVAATPVIGWVGRFSPEKGPDLCIRAAAHLRTPAVTVMIGDGPEMNRVALLAASLGLVDGGRVMLAGFREHAFALLPAFDVLALTSRTEGTPMILLEAVAAGVPIVAFQVGGVPALLDKDSAWLVAEGDLDGLTRALDEALVDSDSRRSRAAIALERVTREHSAQEWHRRVRAVYDAAARRAN